MVSPHDYAEENKEFAKKYIQRLANDTLIVVLPTYYDKERIIKSFTTRGKSERKVKKQKLLNLYAEREIEQMAIIDAFANEFTFCPVLFMPDTLVFAYEMGYSGSFFLDDKQKIDPSITYSNRLPIKFIKQFEIEWQIKVRNKLLPNPFPNHYKYKNGLYGFLGIEKMDVMYRRVVSVFQRRFDQYLANPDRGVRL